MSQASEDSGKQRMLADIQRELDDTRAHLGFSQFDPRVMAAIADVPRERFVPEALRFQAFHDGPLPIGHGQTISQPYIVALMSHLLQLPHDARVLEIGTGSGYQTAILARLAARVYSIEVVEPLATAARTLLDALGCDNVESRAGDGYHGWPEHAPYDGIIVTAAATHVPPPLIEQLKPGARLVIPVGGVYEAQQLLVVEKDAEGRVTETPVLPVAFVPLVRKVEG